MAEDHSVNHLGWGVGVWPYHAAFRILVPQPGMEPGHLRVKAQSLNYLDHQGSPLCIIMIQGLSDSNA